jgi:hypothetical protein
MNSLRRIAVFGGDQRPRAQFEQLQAEVSYYGSQREGGNGPLKRLLSAIRSGAVDEVIVLTRWNGHSATRAVRAACRSFGVLCSLQ